MLKMQSLSKVYRTEMVETYALRHFDLEVAPGEFVAVTGPSGSGKTTFLTIAGLLEAFNGGRYELDGVDVSGMGDDQRSRIRNQKIGFIFQAFNLIPDLNVQDNVEVPLRYRGLPAAERRKRAADALARGSFVDEGGGRIAYVLKDGQAERRAIRLGAQSLAKVEVLQGLQPGDRVVISGAENFGGAERAAVSD